MFPLHLFNNNVFCVFQYHDDIDVGYSSSLACALALLVLLGALQAVVLPRTIILLLLFLTAFVWISVVLMLLLAVRLRWILWDISQSFVLRLAITVFTIVLIYTVAQVNVVRVLYDFLLVLKLTVLVFSLRVDLMFLAYHRNQQQTSL